MARGFCRLRFAPRAPSFPAAAAAAAAAASAAAAGGGAPTPKRAHYATDDTASGGGEGAPAAPGAAGAPDLLGALVHELCQVDRGAVASAEVATAANTAFHTAALANGAVQPRLLAPGARLLTTLPALALAALRAAEGGGVEPGALLHALRGALGDLVPEPGTLVLVSEGREAAEVVGVRESHGWVEYLLRGDGAFAALGVGVKPLGGERLYPAAKLHALVPLASRKRK
jgi:hypothetical protein